MCSNTEKYRCDLKKWLGKALAVSEVSDVACAPAGTWRSSSTGDHRS